jgi:terminase small subunit-like protein
MPGNKNSGRTSTYSEVIARRLCEDISSGRSLADVTRQAWAPSRATVHRWCKDHPEFLAMLDAARELGADALADQILSIADEDVKDSAQASRQRNRIDARRWLSGVIAPRKYGNKLNLDVNVKADPRESERRVALADARLERFGRRDAMRALIAELPDGPAREQLLQLHPEAAPYVPPLLIEGSATRIPDPTVRRAPTMAEQPADIFTKD